MMIKLCMRTLQSLSHYGFAFGECPGSVLITLLTEQAGSRRGS